MATATLLSRPTDYVEPFRQDDGFVANITSVPATIPLETPPGDLANVTAVTVRGQVRVTATGDDVLYLEPWVRTRDGTNIDLATDADGGYYNAAWQIATNTTAWQSFSITFPVVNTTATMTEWRVAELRLTTLRNTVMGGDSNSVQILWSEVDLTYDPVPGLSKHHWDVAGEWPATGVADGSGLLLNNDAVYTPDLNQALPANFGSAYGMTMTVDARLEMDHVDDELLIEVRVYDRTDGVMLAGATSSATNSVTNYSDIGYLYREGTNTTDFKRLTHTFEYVNPTATKAQWDRAEVWFYANDTVVNTDDGVTLSVDYLGFDLWYEPAPLGTATSTLPGVTSSATGTFSPSADGTATSTLAPLTSSATGTFSPSTGVSGTATSALAPIAQAAAGTVADPVFEGTATSALAGIAQAAAGEVAAPTYTGTATSTLAPIATSAQGRVVDTGAITSTLPSVTSAATGTVSAPVIDGTATSTLAGITSSATGRVHDTGSIASTLAPITTAAAGTVEAPVFEAAATSTLAPITSAATGDVEPPVAQAGITSTLARIESSATGTFTDPVITGTASSTLARIVTAAAGAFTEPQADGQIRSTLPGITSSASGTFTKPVFSATAVSVLAGIGSSSTATHDDPDFTGTATSTLGRITASAAGTVAVPVYAGTVSSTLAGIATAAVATHDDPDFTGTATSVLAGILSSALGATSPESPVTQIPFRPTVSLEFKEGDQIEFRPDATLADPRITGTDGVFREDGLTDDRDDGTTTLRTGTTSTTLRTGTTSTALRT